MYGPWCGPCAVHPSECGVNARYPRREEKKGTMALPSTLETGPSIRNRHRNRPFIKSRTAFPGRSTLHGGASSRSSLGPFIHGNEAPEPRRVRPAGSPRLEPPLRLDLPSAATLVSPVMMTSTPSPRGPSGSPMARRRGVRVGSSAENTHRQGGGPPAWRQ